MDIVRVLDIIPATGCWETLAREDIVTVIDHTARVAFARSGDGNWAVFLLASSLGTETERLFACMSNLEVQD